MLLQVSSLPHNTHICAQHQHVITSKCLAHNTHICAQRQHVIASKCLAHNTHICAQRQHVITSKYVTSQYTDMRTTSTCYYK